jgi:hypothetical protein
MISVRFLHREEWEPKLRQYGCKPLEGSLSTAEWWQLPWGGYPITVPVEDDGRCDEEAFRRLILDIVKLAPKGWRFPD